MPKEYIERYKAMQICEMHSQNCFNSCNSYGQDVADKILDDIVTIPTADVVAVKHGEWKIDSDGYYPYCSRCGKEPKNGVMSDFCPDCGAYMRKEDNNA